MKTSLGVILAAFVGVGLFLAGAAIGERRQPPRAPGGRSHVTSHVLAGVGVVVIRADDVGNADYAYVLFDRTTPWKHIVEMTPDFQPPPPWHPTTTNATAQP